MIYRTVQKYFRRVLLLCSLLLSFPFYGCNSTREAKYISLQGSGVGTFYQITLRDSLERDLQPSVDSILQEMNRLFSIFLKTSVIENFNTSSRGVYNAEFATLTRQALAYSKESGGAFDPTIGPLVRLWGFGPDTLEEPDSTSVQELLTRIGVRHIRVEGDSVIKDIPTLSLDYNGIAKGYAVDKVAAFLDFSGIHHYMVNIGGEIFSRGKNPHGVAWICGIETPKEGISFGSSLIRRIQLSNYSIATSGNYRSFREKNGKNWGHTINPKTGYPEHNKLQSATIIASTCTHADALATACMVLGEESAKKLINNLEGVEAVLILRKDSTDYDIWFSSGMRKYLLDEN